MRLCLAAAIGMVAGALGGCLSPQQCYLTLDATGGPTAEACEDGPNLVVRPITTQNSAYYVPTYVLAALSYEGYLTLPSPGAGDSDWLDRPVFDESHGDRPDAGAEGGSLFGPGPVDDGLDVAATQPPAAPSGRSISQAAVGDVEDDVFGAGPSSGDFSQVPIEAPPSTLQEFIQRQFFGMRPVSQTLAVPLAVPAAMTTERVSSDTSTAPRAQAAEQRVEEGPGRGLSPRLLQGRLQGSRSLSDRSPASSVAQSGGSTNGRAARLAIHSVSAAGATPLDERFGAGAADQKGGRVSMRGLDGMRPVGATVLGPVAASPVMIAQTMETEPEFVAADVTRMSDSPKPVLGEVASQGSAPPNRIAVGRTVDGSVLYRRPLPKLDFAISGDLIP